MAVDSGNPYVNSLLLGWKWDTNSLTYATDGTWNTIELAALQAALDSWSAVANLSFTSGHVGNAQLYESLYASTGQPAQLGSHQAFVNFTDTSVFEVSTSAQLIGEFNQSGYGWEETLGSGGLSAGGYGYWTLVHEIGHGLGLDHPHTDGGDDVYWFAGVSDSNDSGDNDLNAMAWSIMSYREGDESKPFTATPGADNYGYTGGPMAFDIATIQYLYGANMSTNSGDDVYVLPGSNAAGTYYTSIWDVGGVDTISASHIRTDVTINLNAATLQNEAGGGGFISQADGIYGGFTIAADFTNAIADEAGETGVIIENAHGGSGDDVLLGNSVDNVLRGNAGNDRLDGGDGIDTADYSLASSSVTINLSNNELNAGADGSDTLIDIENIAGSAFDDLLTGDAGDNVLRGNGGDDTLDGGEGNDTADYSQASAGINIYLQNNSYNSGGDGSDALLSIENIIGSAFVDRIVGDSSDNVLRGGDGNDIIKGKGGTDTIYGDGGNDKLIGDSGNDTIYGGTGNDVLSALAGNDMLYGEEGDDFLYGGQDLDVLFGGAGDDLLRGNRGGDTLHGGADSDRLYGGGNGDVLNGDGGDDYLYGENGNDILNGGSGDDVLGGGAGADTFVVTDGASGYDRINDFENDVDKIDLTGFGFTDFADVLAITSEKSWGLRLDFDQGGALALMEFELAAFDAGDVML